MIRQCKKCNKDFEAKSKQLYCSKGCRKAQEVMLRGSRKSSTLPQTPLSVNVHKPVGLNRIASKYWHKVAPILIKRGHLNVLSEDAFAELCDIYSRLVEINRVIDKTNRSLLQIVDQWDNKNGIESQQFKESALSDLKRKYSARYLDFCKQFYLTPAANRGNFGLGEEGDDKKPGDDKERFF